MLTDIKEMLKTNRKAAIIVSASVLFLLIITLLFLFVFRQRPGQPYARAAVVEDLEGRVTAISGGSGMDAFKGMALLYQDAVGTGYESWTCLELSEQRFVLVEENTNVLISEMAGTPGSAEVTLSEGKIWVIILDELGEKETFEVKTPTGSMAVRGTVFAVEAGSDASRVAVYDGTVSIFAGSETIDATQEAVEIPASGAEANINRTQLTSEDLLPLVAFGEEGPGGVFGKLRGLIADEDIGYIVIKDEKYKISLTRLVLNNKGLTDEDIKPLIYMTNLVYLRLDYNQISDISPLSAMTALAEANLGNNQITDISPLRGLTKLNQLYLNDNNITDWTPVEHVRSVYGRP